MPLHDKLTTSVAILTSLRPLCRPKFSFPKAAIYIAICRKNGLLLSPRFELVMIQTVQTKLTAFRPIVCNQRVASKSQQTKSMLIKVRNGLSGDKKLASIVLCMCSSSLKTLIYAPKLALLVLQPKFWLCKP